MGHEPGKSGLEKVVFLFELEFFSILKQKKHWQLLLFSLLRNRKKILAQIEKTLFLVHIYQAGGWRHKPTSLNQKMLLTKFIP